MSRYCIVGGGLSGLSAAFYIKQSIPNSMVTILEATTRCGGWIETYSTSKESKFEVGPRSIRVASPTSPFLFDMCEKLNLSSSMIPVTKSSPAASKRYVFAHGKLHELKPRLLGSSSLFRKPLLPSLIRSLWKEKDYLNQFREAEMSVDEYFRMHFNDEIADIAINSMIRGIFAGDSKMLGIKSVFPHLIQTEEEHNGLLRGFIKDALLFRQPSSIIQSSLHAEALKKKWSVWGLKGGLETLISTLTEHLNNRRVTFHLNSDCSTLEFLADKEISCIYETEGTTKTIKCDHVFLATPAFMCAKLLRNCSHGSLSSLLDLPFVDVAVVGLDYTDTSLPVVGFGHLIPSWEIPHVLGVIYDSCIYPGGLDSTTKLTCMMGGAWFKKYCSGMTEDDFVDLAQQTVRSQLGINSIPSNYFFRLNRQCIPQYPVGHQENVSRARKILTETEHSISLIGSSFDGVSVNDCVASAYNAIQDILGKSN